MVHLAHRDHKVFRVKQVQKVLVVQQVSQGHRVQQELRQGHKDQQVIQVSQDHKVRRELLLALKVLKVRPEIQALKVQTDQRDHKALRVHKVFKVLRVM